MRRTRCQTCEQLVPVVRGRLKKHTIDHDGPGFPYDCPGSGYPEVDNATARRQKLREAQRARGAEQQAADADALAQEVGGGVTDHVLVQVTTKQLGAVDLLRQSGLWGADTGEVVSGIFAAGLRDAFRWLLDAERRVRAARFETDTKPEKGTSSHANARPPRRRPARARRRVR